MRHGKRSVWMTAGLLFFCTISVANSGLCGPVGLAADQGQKSVERMEETTFGDWTYYRALGPGHTQICGFEGYMDNHYRKFDFNISIGGNLRRAVTILGWVDARWNWPPGTGTKIQILTPRRQFSVSSTISAGKVIMGLNPFNDDFGAEFVAELAIPGTVFVRSGDDPWTLLPEEGRANAVQDFARCFQNRSRGF